MKVIDFLDRSYDLSEEDKISLEKEVDLKKHWLLSAACAEWISPIKDDEVFCDAEWNFMRYWFENKGFSDNDYRYIKSCGYDDDQFSKEAI